MNIKKLTAFLVASTVTLSGCPTLARAEGIQNNTVVAAQNKSTLHAGVISQFVDFTKEETDILDGYTTTRVNIRELPTTESEIIDVCDFNTPITFFKTNEEWYTVCIDGFDVGYVKSDYVSEDKCDYMMYELPYTSNTKTWMGYKTITSRSSAQYKLQQIAYTGNYGIRMVDGRYCVALGTYFDIEIGQYFDLILGNETVISCVLGDVKSPEHTTSDGLMTRFSNCMSEFIVDSDILDKNAKRDGNMSSIDGWDSPVVKVVVYEKKVSF